MYRRISFEDFEKSYINSPDGYLTVWAGLDDETDSVNLDMICNYRLQDGKVQFLEVPFESEEQLDKIWRYLYITTSILHKEVIECADNLLKDYNGRKKLEDSDS